MIRKILGVAGIAALFLAGPAGAELVYFVRGGQAQLPAKVDGERVDLITPDGPIRFPRADFEAIVPGNDPTAEWPSRRDLARKEPGAEARFTAAWWALENGLTFESVSLLDELRSVEKLPAPVSRAIGSLTRLSSPCPDPNLEALRARFRPLRFRETRSPHAVLFHQHREAEALERLDLIERVLTTFQVAFAAQGVEVSMPRQRLVSIYFADQRDYSEALQRSGAEVFADTQGYYHPILKAVLAFDARSGDEQQAGRRAIANRKLGGETESELARRSLLLDLDRRATDLGILAHETIHQLTIETGLSPRTDDFPVWLHEGLAAQFEVIRGGRWAGVGKANDRRLPDWRAIKPPPRLSPLLHDSGFGRGYRRDLYAQSWALVYFLRKAHSREFLSFLDLLRTPTADSTARPDRAYEAFLSAFGRDLGRIEAEWHRFLAEQVTPLEQGRPLLR